MKYRIPADYRHTRSTPFWDRDTVPGALLTHHNTKKGVYGRLSVMQGAVKYIGFNHEGRTQAGRGCPLGGIVSVEMCWHPDAAVPAARYSTRHKSQSRRGEYSVD